MRFITGFTDTDDHRVVVDQDYNSYLVLECVSTFNEKYDSGDIVIAFKEELTGTLKERISETLDNNQDTFEYYGKERGLFPQEIINVPSKHNTDELDSLYLPDFKNWLGRFHIRKNFYSLTEAVRVADNLPEEVEKEMRESATSSRTISEHVTDFTRTKDWEEAKELVRRGWDEGARKFKDKIKKVDDIVGSKSNVKMPVHDVHGSTVDMGRYMAGIPENMIRWEDHEIESEGEIARICLAAATSYDIPSGYITRRGVGVLALCDALEKAGRDTEVWVNMHSMGTNNYDQLEYNVLVKKSSDPLDIAKMAFVLSHPSMQRRVMLGIMENNSKFVRVMMDIPGDYGIPRDASDKDGYDVYLGTMLSRDRRWRSMESTAQWVRNELEKQGVEFE